MNFDPIAPFYGTMERLLAGSCMRRTREWLMNGNHRLGNVLMVGEGPGVFLKGFRRRFPDARITVVDGSAKMLELARHRLGDDHGVSFVHSMIGEWETDQKFDLIVTNFLLDCLPQDEVRTMVGKLAGCATADAQWWIAEFNPTGRGVSGWRSRIIVRLLYGFFSVVAGIKAREIHPPDPFLIQAGFACDARETFSWHLLKGERWIRGNGESLLEPGSI